MRRLTIALLLPLCACGDDNAAKTEGAALSAHPLPVRAQSATPRFVRRTDTGITFSNELRRENLLPYLYSGAGVAVGDYDDDGWPDVYLVSQDGPNKLFRQTAAWTFEDVTSTAGEGLDGGPVWGASASFADIDGDGDLDLYVCNTEAPNQLFQNRGDGTFVEVGGKFGVATKAASIAAAFADYDNDGDLDFYLLTNRVYAPGVPKVLVDESTPPSGTRSTKAEMFPPVPPLRPGADGVPIIPDGYEDFVAIHQNRAIVAGQRDRLYRNDGYARWTDVTDAAGIYDQGLGLSVTWWDGDGDGNLDIYVANDLEAPDVYYRNRGDGTFEDVTKTALPHIAYFGMGSDFGDINNDGRFDFVVGDMSSTSHYMGKMLMGSMSDKRWFLMNAEPRQHMRNALFLNSGTERFLEGAYLANLASSDWTWAVRFVDFDEDGWLDFYATNGIPRFNDDPDASTAFKKLWRSGAHERALDVYRKLEPVPERNIARRNTGRGLRFEDVGAKWGLDEKSVGQGAALADLDRDGDLDVLVNNLNQEISILENTSSGTHRIAVELVGVQDNRAGLGSKIEVEAGGITQTRLVSQMRGYRGSEEAREVFGLGTDVTTIDRLTVRWPGGAVQSFENLDADHTYTVRQMPSATASDDEPTENTKFSPDGSLADRVHVERDFDDYVSQPLLPHRLSRLGPGLAVADINGDGRDDIYLGGAAGQSGSLRIATTEGWEEIDGPWARDSECEDMGAVFLDADADGDLDLFVASGGIETGEDNVALRDRLYLQIGPTTFKAAPSALPVDLRRSSSSVAAVDMDRDGDVELFVGTRVLPGRYPESAPSVLLSGDGSGRFADSTAEFAPGLADAGMVTGAVWGDIDADGWPDLVVASHWRPIQVFRNVEGPSSTRVLQRSAGTSTLDAVRGLWNGVALADLDGDLDLDIIATNLGLNSKYHADTDHPMRVFADDFDADGQLDIIEAKSKGDTLLPVRGLSCSSSAMPFLNAKFGTYDAFAKASLEEIYGGDPLAKAASFEATELQHTVFENLGAGSWKAHPLPRITQIAPAFGIALVDADLDGALDIVLAQNFDSPEPETGRMSGGLGALVLVKDDMRFVASPPTASGLVIPEDAMGLVTAHSSSTPLVIATANDGPTRSFALRLDGTPQVSLRLVGPPGNPNAIGARLTITSEDGNERLRTIDAGSGYLSQSSATISLTDCAVGDTIRVLWPDGHASNHTLETSTGDIELAR